MEYTLNQNTCVICYSSESSIITTKCGHSYCSSCFLTWYFTKITSKQECCYCRQKISIEEHINESFSEIKEYYTLKQLVKNNSFFKLKDLKFQFIVKGLIPACYYNDLDLVASVIENELIDFDIPDTLLYFACISGKKEVLYYFIDFRYSHFSKALIIHLLSLNYIEIVEFIYKSTSKVADIYEVISYFIKQNEVDVVKKILNNDLLCNTLTLDEDLIELCVIHSNLDLLKEFEKIEPSLIDENVIYTASSYDKDAILKYVLSKGNIRYSIYDSYFLAIESECYKSLTFLLKNRKSDYEIFLANNLCDKYNEIKVKAFISQLNL